MQFGYAIGNPVKIGEICSALSNFRKKIPDSEIAASYINAGSVKVFANEEDAAKYARSKRDDFGDILQPSYFYVEIQDNVIMEEKEETCKLDPIFARTETGIRCVSASSIYSALYYETEASNLTPIRGHLSKNVRFSVELTPEGVPLHTPSICAMS
ncbi:MAG: hypothetical protein Q8R24_09495 [Legionellaceae bacterium]|nr:hypothetical protein [Legionellaceae bacterium]